jgi:molybdate transport system ATP-binding protein
VIELEIQLTQGTFRLDVTATFNGKATAIFGPSGSGKTTTLDAIAGLRAPDRGVIRIDGRALFSSRERVNLPSHQRRVGYVPQDVALFPHMNVRLNLLYGRHPGTSPPLERVVSMLEIESLVDREVGALSGGERQRIALGRALMSGPSLLLLDEPLAAVDVPLRRRILPYLQRVRDELHLPLVYVSHDREEVQRLADYVIVLEAGRVSAAGSPATLLGSNPGTLEP